MSINQQKDTSQNYNLIQELPADQSLGVLEPVMYYNGAMPTGVTVSQQGRIFVNFPKWGDNVQFTVAEIKNGKMVAYPDEVLIKLTLMTMVRHWSRCNPIVEGRPFLEHLPNGSIKQGASMGADGIAISSDGSRLYYCPLGSRKLYSVDTDSLVDRSLNERKVADTVVDGDRGGASDGLESDATGYIYSTNYEHNSIMRRHPNNREWETVVHDPRLLWPDTLSVATDGYLYVTANQLHRQARYQKGHDLRRKPYTLFRVHINTTPVLLK